jgi:hypothetical protein
VERRLGLRDLASAETRWRGSPTLRLLFSPNAQRESTHGLSSRNLNRKPSWTERLRNCLLAGDRPSNGEGRLNRECQTSVICSHVRDPPPYFPACLDQLNSRQKGQAGFTRSSKTVSASLRGRTPKASGCSRATSTTSPTASRSLRPRSRLCRPVLRRRQRGHRLRRHRARGHRSDAGPWPR